MTLFSTAIEGETPIDDPSGLKDRSIRTRAQLNMVEAENIRKACAKYYSRKLNRRTAPFDLRWALRLHKEMFGNVWRWAGQTRTRDLNLGESWRTVEQSLYSLLEDVHVWQANGFAWVTQGAWLHHRAVQIHPFLNGNGRWSRMLSNVWLRLSGQPIVSWPDQTIGQESSIRHEYLEAIKLADNGEYDALVELHERYCV